jgi:PAS domain S-box-containing protein
MNNSKILLVDDEPLNLKLYDKMLKEHNFVITTATNGQECLDRVREEFPDLIILDWNMPVMNGIDALETLKKDSSTKDIPVLMVTGVMTSSEDLAYAMTVGAVDFLKKPFDKQELNARVRNILLLSESLKALKDQNILLEDKNLFITSLFESIPHPVIYCSPEGVLFMCNHCFEEIIGAEKAELIGKTVYRHFNNEEVAFHIQKDMELIQTKSALTYEKNGFPGKKTYLISKNLVFDRQDEPKGIVSVFTDVSEIKRANEEIINVKKAELISGTIKLMNVNELNSNLISDLQKLLPLTGKDGHDLIRQIENKYKLAEKDQLWSDFESRFEHAFDSLFKVLLEKFPTLTPNERKLCALLRSGLSSKDIAMLTFQNPQSVDVARYRLRKKLNLANDENLIDFLLAIE